VSLSKKNIWANEIIQVAAAFTLKKSLFVFSQKFFFIYKFFECQDLPLLIGFENNHFVPFLTTIDNVNISASIDKKPVDILESVRKSPEFHLLKIDL
jgi:hypothetical protein